MKMKLNSVVLLSLIMTTSALAADKPTGLKKCSQVARYNNLDELNLAGGSVTFRRVGKDAKKGSHIQFYLGAGQGCSDPVTMMQEKQEWSCNICRGEGGKEAPKSSWGKARDFSTGEKFLLQHTSTIDEGINNPRVVFDLVKPQDTSGKFSYFLACSMENMAENANSPNGRSQAHHEANAQGFCKMLEEYGVTLMLPEQKPGRDESAAIADEAKRHPGKGKGGPARNAELNGGG